MAAITTLDIGDDAVCTATFKVAGVLTTPTTVLWYVWPPGETTPDTYVGGVAPEATTPSTGTVRLQVPVPPGGAGTWEVKVEGDGTAKGARKGRFYVEPDPS